MKVTLTIMIEENPKDRNVHVELVSSGMAQATYKEGAYATCIAEGLKKILPAITKAIKAEGMAN